MTHLWVFRISPKASYTGGMLLVTADTFEDVKKFWAADTSKLDYDVSGAIYFALSAKDAEEAKLTDTWIFERAFQVSSESGWVCWEYACG